MGLVLMLGAMVGDGFVDVAASFKIVVRTCRWDTARPSEILTYHSLKLFQCQWFNVQLPVQVLTHLLLHLVDLPQLKHALPNYTPRLI
jgi:hypothetical protein